MKGYDEEVRGAAIGGIAGLAVGVSALVIPGIGEAIAVGPLAVAIGSVGIGALAGGIMSALTTIPRPGAEKPPAQSPRTGPPAPAGDSGAAHSAPSASRVYLDGLEMIPRQSDFEEFEHNYRADFKARNLTGYTYEQFSPAYRYGYNLATDPRFANEDWLAVEEYARREWERDNPGSWDKVRDAVRYAWQSQRFSQASR